MLPEKLLSEAAPAQLRLEDLRWQLCARRKKTLAISGGAAGLCAVLALAGIAAKSPMLAIIAGVGAVAAFVCMFVFATNASSKYAAAYKHDICNIIARHFSPSLRYDENDGISSGVFKASGIFSQSPDRYKTSDLVEGAYGKTKLRFARIHAEKRHVEHGKNGTRTRYTTIFKGVLFIADFNKHFRGRTSVRTDVAEKLLGKFGRVFQKTGAILGSEKLVQLESPGFEKEFAVFSDDQVEARYILSPALMERMIALKKRIGADVQFSFRDSNVFIAIPHTADLFAASLAIPASDTAQLEDNHRRLAFFLGIVDDLDLDTRIWSKE